MFKATSFASKIAHSSTIPALGNKDLKSLQDLLIAEKSVVSSLQRLSTDLARSSDSLKVWGNGEGIDLADVLSRSSSILSHVSSALSAFASHEQVVREYMKAIRSREERLDQTRTRRKAVGSKADAAERKLTKMGSENKNLPAQTDLLNSLRDEMRQLDSEILTEEAGLGDFKRSTTKNFMLLKLGGLLEFAEKATIVGELGKLIIEEIPMEPTLPGQSRNTYTGQEKTASLEEEVSKCVAQVVFTGSTGDQELPVPGPTHSRDPSAGGQQGFQTFGGPSSPAIVQSSELPYVLPGIDTDHPAAFMSHTSPTLSRSEPMNVSDFGETTARMDMDSAVSPTTVDREHYLPPDSQPRLTSDNGAKGGKFSTFPLTSRFNRSGGRINEPLAEASMEPAAGMATAVPEYDPYGDIRGDDIPRYMPPAGQPPEQSLNAEHVGTESQEYSEESSHPHKAVRFISPTEEEFGPQDRRLESDGEALQSSTYQPQPQFLVHRIPPPSIQQGGSNQDADVQYNAIAGDSARQMSSFQFQQSNPVARTPSPLLPPTLPFANRSVSPGPPQNLESAMREPISPLRTSPPQVTQPIGPNRVERPRTGSQGSLNMMSSSPRPSLSEYGGLSPSTRTISAGAFKKVTEGNTSPLHPRKRTLPTSPYPPHRMPSTGTPASENQPSSLSMTTGAPNDGPTTENGYRSPTDLPPSYRSMDGHDNGPASPREDYGHLGHVVVVNADITREGDVA